MAFNERKHKLPREGRKIYGHRTHMARESWRKCLCFVDSLRIQADRLNQVLVRK